jgi:hypothetical protein
MSENYDGLDWSISNIPIGCSTPDELFEYSYRAETECPDCGKQITGIAQYWSHNEKGLNSWLERIDYEPCECTVSEDEDDELMDDYFKSIA